MGTVVGAGRLLLVVLVAGLSLGDPLRNAIDPIKGAIDGTGDSIEGYRKYKLDADVPPSRTRYTLPENQAGSSKKETELLSRINGEA
jgi:hypothetical protein